MCGKKESVETSHQTGGTDGSRREDGDFVLAGHGETDAGERRHGGRPVLMMGIVVQVVAVAGDGQRLRQVAREMRLEVFHGATDRARTHHRIVLDRLRWPYKMSI